ncbi:MAG: hypothetical protein JXD23_02095 [Spirochaetales bacterium]|nr:hypothetical protein [Spirochaetales bacterium]
MKEKLSREEQAKLEIGKTDISKAASRALVVVFLLAIASVPIVQGIHELAGYLAGKEKSLLPSFFTMYSDVGESVKKLADGRKDFASGVFDANEHLLQGIIRYEDDLENDSVFRNAVIPPSQALFAKAFHLGNENVVIGRDGWLFYEPGIRYLTSAVGENAVAADRSSAKANTVFVEKKAGPLQAIVDFNRQLRERNIRLILMPVPIKPMFYPEKISVQFNGANGYLRNPYFDELKKELEEQGIPIVDTAPLLERLKKTSGREIFLKMDSHWTPETVAAAAESLAAFIEKNIDLSIYNSRPLKTRTIDVVNVGDIARMLLKSDTAGPEYTERASITQIVSNNNEPWSSDRNAEILFLGDSFANIYSLGAMGWGESAGLVEQLSFFLNRPIDRIVRNDNGAFATRQALQYELSRGRDRLAGKKVVVWEFAVRELATGDWKTLPLKLNESRESSFFTPEAGKEAVVTGVVGDVSSRPIPGTTPYKDHIMTFHLVDVIINGETEKTYDALVYAFSMTDNVPAPASQYRVGQNITVRLKRWYDVNDKYDSINRSEIDDGELLFEDPCWAEEIIQ